MERAQNITGKILGVGSVWLLSTIAMAQTMTFRFDANGAATREHVSQGGTGVNRYDEFHRLVEEIHYFDGGKRVRMSDKYRYENNMVVEHIAYLYTQGYERTVNTYDAKGNSILQMYYTSQTEGDWKEIEMMEERYDERNNRTYFNCRSFRSGIFSHLKVSTSYNYSTGMRTVNDIEYDQNGRVLSNYTFTNGMGDFAMNNKPDYTFNLQTDGPNMRPGKVINWKGTDRYGNNIERVFVDMEVWSQTTDKNGRVIRIALETSAAYENDIAIYKEYENIEFQYDDQGRLTQHISQHYDYPKEKTTFSYGRNIEAKHFRMSKNGGWLLVDTKNYSDISQFTPPRSSAQSVVSSVQQTSYPAPVASSYESPMDRPAAQTNTSQSLVGDIKNLEAANGSHESLSAFAADAEKLSHIADVLSHTTGTTITEEQVLALAMKLLIENYKSDLREMNTAYLRDKVSVFD